jgi:beta-1,4-N-acetylglucosaminyltransferase
MIFITVGTGNFDRLIRAIDNSAKSLKEKIVAQIGDGEYLPQNIEYFRFKPNLNKEYGQARLIIAHGGAGTTFELLKMGKKLISVANLDRTDKHQEDILRALSKKRYILWCRNPNEIYKSIAAAKSFKFQKYKKPECHIANEIKEYLEGI